MRTIIWGASGQDGSYLAEHLLEKGHEVIGIARRTSTPNTERLVNVLGHDLFSLLVGDITDFGSVLQIIQEYPADWVINLAAQSHVGTSFQQACSSMDITAKGCINILEAIRLTDINNDFDVPEAGYRTKFYQASSSEMFGTAKDFHPNNGYTGEEGGYYQNENTKFEPQSPYAVAKVAAHNFCRLYRDAYNMDIRCGILFNHESERRGEEFVTRKITKWLGEFVNWKNEVSKGVGISFESNEQGKELTLGYISTFRSNPNNEPYGHGDSWLFGPKHPKLRLGNLDASRDFGYAPDYVKAMTLMMEAEEADDWVVSTGDTHTISEFLELAFELAGLGCWKQYVVIDESLKRPAEVPFLKGDSSKIRNTLGWRPEISFAQLVKKMVDHDINKHRGSENGPISG